MKLLEAHLPRTAVRTAYARFTRYVRNFTRELTRRAQLASRGWADEDTWNLDIVLAKRLGAQLVYLAETAHGVPARAPYTSPKTYDIAYGHDQTTTLWQEDLRRHGDALLAYAATASTGEVVESIAAKAALQFVAENFESLWD